MDFITFLGFPGLVTNGLKLKFDDPSLEKSKDKDGFVYLSDIIYHIVRCRLIHGQVGEKQILWQDDIIFSYDENNNLILSSKLPWGLLGSVIISEKNKDEQIDSTYWYSFYGFKYYINDLWGRRDIIANTFKNIIKSAPSLE